MLFRCRSIWTWTAHPFLYVAVANRKNVFSFVYGAIRQRRMCENGAEVNRLYMWQYVLDHCRAKSDFLASTMRFAKRVNVCACVCVLSFPLANPICSLISFLAFSSKLTVWRSRCQQTSTLDRMYYWLDFTSNMLLNLSHISDGFVMDFIIEREY